jgi:hypothetical protein
MNAPAATDPSTRRIAPISPMGATRARSATQAGMGRRPLGQRINAISAQARTGDGSDGIHSVGRETGGATAVMEDGDGRPRSAAPGAGYDVLAIRTVSLEFSALKGYVSRVESDLAVTAILAVTSRLRVA